MELDPKQTQFLKLYLDPKSDTYSNALQSALKAGYKQQYAENITTLEPDWLLESIGRRKRILDKAEKRLETLLDSEDEKVVADLVKHTTKTLGKEHYSERSELTGAGGKDLVVNVIKYGGDNNSTSIQT